MAIRASRTDATSVKTADGAVKATAGRVFWIAASAGATGGAFQINDSTDDTGTDKLDVVMPASSVVFLGPLDPPIECATGIFLDVPGTNLTVTVGYQ